MKILVGYTGFVGSNLFKYGEFDYVYNTKNIEDAFQMKPDVLVYAGVRAEKFLANNNKAADFDQIKEAYNNILKINPKKVVLISTIDVYKNPVDVNENTPINLDGLHPYGLNRYLLEEMVKEGYPNSLIIRLPGLFGENLKKNFIYDLINIIPSMLTEKKYKELAFNSEKIKRYYVDDGNGFYKCKALIDVVKCDLKKEFLEIGFSALNFTDSRGIFQFYNLANLYKHIEIALDNNIKLINMATEPVCINEIYQRIYHKDFINILDKPIPNYDFKTTFSELYGGRDGYIFDKEEVLNDIIDFIKGVL